MRPRRAVTLLVAVVALLSSCTVETATAPRGDLALRATFDNVQDLTAGHFVQASNVVIGSVVSVRLDGYRAAVELSIVDGRRIPVGTRAVIRRTSLLGEHFVDLVFPDTFDPEHGPFMASGDEIGETETQADLEQVAEQAASIIGAVTADDVAALVHAGAEGLGGRGATLNQLIADAAAVAGALGRQRDAVATAVDGAGALGAALAPTSEQLSALIDELATVTGMVAGEQDRMVSTLQALVDFASTTTDVVLVPHADRLVTMLAGLEPVLGDLAARSDVLAGLVTDLLRFTEALPTAVHEGTLLLLTWGYLDVPLLQDDGFSDDPVQALLEFLGAGA